MAAYRRVHDYVTCGLTAYDRDQLRTQRSYPEWATFYFFFNYKDIIWFFCKITVN